MLIDDLVEYCDEQYQSGECGACTGKDRCVNECDGNCKLCLDDIHFHEQQRRTQYDCERLLYYYVCRYSYKYCSEMIYALRQIDLSDYPYFHILSMGCGGAPDLMAFQYMNYPQKLSYVGLDKNVYWEEIHNFIIDNYDDGKVQFLRNIDVLQYFDNREITKCNVIIIQYLISYFYSNSESWTYHIIAERLIAYKYGRISEVQVQNIEKNLSTIIQQFEEMKKDLVFLLSENGDQQN